MSIVHMVGQSLHSCWPLRSALCLIISAALSSNSSNRTGPLAVARCDCDLCAQAARELLTMDEDTPKRLFEGEALLRRMYRYGLLEEGQNKLDFVLALNPNDVLERRLQTLVFKLGLAKSIHHARVLIRQRHIRSGFFTGLMCITVWHCWVQLFHAHCSMWLNSASHLLQRRLGQACDDTAYMGTEAVPWGAGWASRL